MFRSGKTFFQIDSAAEAFSYFLNVVEKWHIEKVDIHSAVLSLSKLASQDFPDMTVIRIREAEIICTFTSLKNKNSSGYNSISYRILKFCGKSCGKPIAHIFNKSLKIDIFPDHLKYSVINPLFKKKKSELTNYRPVSLLNGFSKIF